MLILRRKRDMLGRHWKALAMATVAAMAISACADEAADDTMGETGADTAATAPQPTAGQAGQVAADLPEGVTQEQFQQGQQLFTGQGGCMACHGPQATGTQLGPDLTDGEWLNVSARDYDEIVQVIQDGVAQPVEYPGPMPPMGGANLSAEQVNALAAYVVGISQG